MKRFSVLPLLGLLLLSPRINAAEQIQTISFEQKMMVDRLGDCSISLEFSMTAQQYSNWYQKYGQNKSLLKRDLGKVVSQYDTYDWDLQVKEMERTVILGVRAHGVVKHRGNGNYEFPVPKSWKGGDRNGTTLAYNYVESLGPGTIAQYNVKVVLPTDATEIKDDTGESGERVVRYTVPLPSSTNKGLLIGGGASALLGLALVGASITVGGKRREPAPTA